MHLIKLTLPWTIPIKQVLLIGKRVYQRFPREPWEPIDPKILECTPIMRSAIMEHREV